MAQLSSVVEPYGEVNVFPEGDGKVRIKATILMKPDVEGAQTGLAIDGSKSMAEMFGGQVAVSTLFGSNYNVVQPVARTMAEYLAKFDSDGETSVIYWACGMFGNDIEVVGDMTAEKAIVTDFSRPKNMGSGTKLLPAIKYYTEERFRYSPWGIYLFITDGKIEDLDAVKAYTKEICQGMASGDRGFTKLVIIGLGNEFYYENKDENKVAQSKLTLEQAAGRLVELDNDDTWEKSAAWQVLEELDDLDEDPEYGLIKDSSGDYIDIWDHKLAASMKSLEEIFAEVVSRHMTVSPSAEITDSNGSPVKPVDRDSYSDGLPALIEFTMPRESTSFTLSLPNGSKIVQPISL